MDLILVVFFVLLLKFVEGSLFNDEVFFDEEMLVYFIDNGFIEEQVWQVLIYCDQYFNNIYLDGFMLIIVVDEVFYFNLYIWQFELD